MMRRTDKTKWILGILVVLSLGSPAYAYMDPGTGSMVTAALISAFATLAFGIKTYWFKLVSLFRRGSGDGGAGGASRRKE